MRFIIWVCKNIQQKIYTSLYISQGVAAGTKCWKRLCILFICVNCTSFYLRVTTTVEEMVLHPASMDDLSDDILSIIARAVPPAALFTILLLSHQYKNIVKARVVQLAALRGPPFHLSPSLILDFHGSSVSVNLCNIGDVGMQVFSTALAGGGMSNLVNLQLNHNQISDVGMKAFSAALAGGALSSCHTLHFGGNNIGDAGIEAFSKACAGGALVSVTTLRLNSIQISDVGMQAFSSALAAGAMAQLKALYLNDILSDEKIGDVGMRAFSSAIASGALPLLEELWLQNNQIGNSGIAALVNACVNGALPHLKTHLMLFGNPASEAVQRAAKDTITNRK